MHQLLIRSIGLLICFSLPSGATSATGNQKIIDIVNPVLKTSDKLISAMPAADSIESLSAQITGLLSNSLVEKQYRKANEQLNSIAAIDNHTGPAGTPNFFKVSEGIYRSANPTVGQVKSLVTSGKIDNVLALNIELSDAIRYDPKPSAPLTPSRKAKIEEKLRKKGKSNAKIKRKLKFYEEHLEYAVTLKKKKFEWLELIPINTPQESIKKYFTALKRIKQLRLQKKNVLIHCTVGKHRTGLVSMLVRVLDNKGQLPPSLKDELYLEFVKRNWNRKAQTRIQHMIVLPAIVKSAPFKDVLNGWSST